MRRLIPTLLLMAPEVIAAVLLLVTLQVSEGIA